jgi:hypothetical protein
MKRIKIARVLYINVLQGIHKALNYRFFIVPCHLDWSSANSRRFAISAKNSKCLKFVASSFGDFFVVFATNPNNEWTWYYFQISSHGVALYRAGLVVKYQLDLASGSLNSDQLFRTYFICMAYEQRLLVTDDMLNSNQDNMDFADTNAQSFTFFFLLKLKNLKNYFVDEQKLKETLSKKKYTTGLFIQYGVVRGFEAQEDVKLAFYDENPLEPRYYMFGRYLLKIDSSCC